MSLRLHLSLAIVNYYHFGNAIGFDNHSQQRLVAIEMNLVCCSTMEIEQQQREGGEKKNQHHTNYFTIKTRGRLLILLASN